ncbi:Protein of uncharacterised function (DUF3170) [Acinetobacter baumannii]|nr:Protein of uncharacterised function (DUF3170) [Acinetobacter baumannii]
MHLHHLETAGERGILLDVFLVFRPGGGADGAQLAARQCRFQQVGGVASALGAAGADQGVNFVDKQDDRRRAGLHFIDHRLQPLFKLALDAGAGLQHADVQQAQLHVAQLRRHVAGHDAQRQAFHHGGFADAGLAGQQRVVLAAAHQNIDNLPDLFIAAGHRVDLAVARSGGQILGILRQHAFTAARRAGQGLGAALCRRVLGVFRRVSGNGGELFHQQIGVDALELRGNGLQQMAQAVGFQNAEQQVAAADARRAEFQ